MDFILRHDWLHRGSESAEFLTERALLRSNLHRIISGTFRDPLISDEDSEDDQHHDIDSMLRQYKARTHTKKEIPKKAFVPGLRPLPCFPRQSSLSKEQHARGLRVLGELDKTISTFSPYHASQVDKQAYKEMQEVYVAEQKEFHAWAAREWVEGHCVRALRPLPLLERVYTAEWSTHIASSASLPTHYEYAAQIDMSANGESELIHQADLKKIQISQLPTIELPSLDKNQSVAGAIPEEYLPRACRQHPCRIVLPDEDRTCTLPLREVHSELCKFAARHDTSVVASERALRCLLQADTTWNLPVTVQHTFTPRGVGTVVVLDSEVRPRRELTRARSARALHLLLRHSLTLNSRSNTSSEDNEQTSISPQETKECQSKDTSTPEAESSDEEGGLQIDLGDEDRNGDQIQMPPEKRPSPEKIKERDHMTNSTTPAMSTDSPPSSHIPNPDMDLLPPGNCTCRGTPFETPPYISYKKWLLKRKSTQDDCIPVIIHCSHKHKKDKQTEVILNVISEYQIELGATAVSPSRLRSCALALQLRDNAAMLSARIDATNGQIVTLEYTDRSRLETEYKAEHGSGPTEQGIAAIHNVLLQLCQLKPNRYILHHEPQHGDNALLFVMSRAAGGEHTLSLAVDHGISEDSERKHLQTPPVLSAALLPVHKMRRMLPLAFSPYPPMKKPKPPTKEEKQKAALQKYKREKNAKKRANRKRKREAASATVTGDKKSH